ncbi:MAG: hypothetical protein FWG53_10070 [Clostridiales bacterium]|nr:hypothetical protein [Clostridiales bacterium]
MLTQARKDIIVGILKDNQELTKLDRDEALVEINKFGHDFTPEELEEFASDVRISVPADLELDFEQLDAVAGGAININIENFICWGKKNSAISAE